MDLKVFIGVRSNGQTADAYYRCLAPWSVIRWWLNDEDAVRVNPPNDVDVEWADVCIFQRPVEPAVECFMWQAKSRGKPVIVDVDDNLFAIPPSAGNLFDYYNERGTLRYREPLSWHARMLRLADVVTVTTDRLGQLLRQYVPDMAPTVTIPNRELRGDWDWVEPAVDLWDGRPLVGWVGFYYYWDHLRDLLPALWPVIEHHDAVLVLAGMPEVARALPAFMRDDRHLALYDLVPS